MKAERKIVEVLEGSVSELAHGMQADAGEERVADLRKAARDDAVQRLDQLAQLVAVGGLRRPVRSPSATPPAKRTACSSGRLMWLARNHAAPSDTAIPSRVSQMAVSRARRSRRAPRRGARRPAAAPARRSAQHGAGAGSAAPARPGLEEARRRRPSGGPPPCRVARRSAIPGVETESPSCRKAHDAVQPRALSGRAPGAGPRPVAATRPSASAYMASAVSCPLSR